MSQSKMYEIFIKGKAFYLEIVQNLHTLKKQQTWNVQLKHLYKLSTYKHLIHD